MSGKFTLEESHSPVFFPKDLVRFLTQSGKPEAIAVLAQDLGKRPLYERSEVIEAMLCEPLCEAFKAENGKDETQRKLRTAVESLLVAALNDTEQRICDMAGGVLNQLDPAKYPFNLAAPLAQRDREIFAMKNVWRQANGPPALPEHK